MDQSKERCEALSSRSVVNDLVCGLRDYGLSAADMALVSQDPTALEAMARAAITLIRRERAEVVKMSEFRKVEKETLRLAKEPHRLMRICGTTRYHDRSFANLIHGVVVEPSARTLLEQKEVFGADEATLFTFRVIPTAPFFVQLHTPDEIMDHAKISKVLRIVYPKFDQSMIDPSLIVGLLKERLRLLAIAEEQKLTWFLLLHKPMCDITKETQLLEIRIKDKKQLRLRAITVKNDTIWSTDGAFLVLSH